MKIAFVHDWLVTEGGSEKVLTALLELFQGPVFTLFAKDLASFKDRKIYTSFLQSFPGIHTYYRNLLPLFPLAIQRFDLSSYDYVFSSSHCVAKSIPIYPGQKHICYCHTPMRYVWQPHLTQASLLKKVLMMPFLSFLRVYDHKTAKRVHYFIANSTHVARRIYTFYGRESVVIHPPIDTQAFFIASEKEEYYLACCRLVPYKRVDLLLEAFARLPKEKLFIIGTGPEEKKLRAKAPPNVTFFGYVPDMMYREMLSKAKAFLHAGEEDFGMALAEAQSAGVPGIAYGVGGSLDILIPGETGIFFKEQTTKDVLEAITLFEKAKQQFLPLRVKKHAEKFSKHNFLAKMQEFIQSVC